MSAQDQETAEAERLAAVARQINAGTSGRSHHAHPRWAGLAGPATPLILEEDDLCPRELRELEDWEAQEHCTKNWRQGSEHVE